MLVLIHLFSVGCLFVHGLAEDILLPSTAMDDPSFRSVSSIYLCHVHQLNNTVNLYLQGYRVIDGGKTGHVHHLLLYECSAENATAYSGLCGKDNARSMPSSVYRHCQTRIIIAWAQGGQVDYEYPKGTGLRFRARTSLLLEVHFEPSVPRQHSIGLRLKFYPIDELPGDEIGVLTLGTLARSTLFLPPRLDRIRFPTYCSNDCLFYFLRKHPSIKIFSVLVHAHRRAVRITLEHDDSSGTHRLLDRNPFEFHRQECHHFSKPYPEVTATSELTLICSYSTRNDSSRATVGGHDANDEMCQAFLYYFPKVPSFPLCLSLPMYSNRQHLSGIENWTDGLSLSYKAQLESNRNHLSMCGDNIHSHLANQTALRTKSYQRSMPGTEHFPLIYIRFSASSPIYISVVVIVLLVVFLSGYTIARR